MLTIPTKKHEITVINATTDEILLKTDILTSLLILK